jgi:protein ImuB
MPPAAPNRPDPRSRRILSLWFPRLAADRVLRCEPGLAEAPLAVVSEVGNLRQISALNALAETRGLHRGQPLSEAVALCPDLVTRIADPSGEAAFLTALRRWAGKFSPWVAEAPPEGLMIDLTGCAHLFGGEEALFPRWRPIAPIWASPCGPASRIPQGPPGHWRGSAGPAPQGPRAVAMRSIRRHAPHVRGPASATGPRADPPHQPRLQPTRHRSGSRNPAKRDRRSARSRSPRSVSNRKPPKALRALVSAASVTCWACRARVLPAASDLTWCAAWIRPWGWSPNPSHPPPPPFISPYGSACRIPSGWRMTSLRVSTGLRPCCATSSARGGAARGACGWRRVARRRRRPQVLEMGLARPTDRPDQLRPLFALKTGDIDAGFGIDRLRLSAPLTEPLHATEHKGGWVVSDETTGARGDRPGARRSHRPDRRACGA